ncbi:MAG: HlyD family type I secretion periplasmic adaptor subunit [Magnetococcales bacterium]|nr:HlyD family type I secretion periplasmic adaptor subunit [Magnetococcales bacterium]MBF0437654.1 HlyD family type I secretion periplasmic adaptor subunit [Magnetococcales bacterium]
MNVVDGEEGIDDGVGLIHHVVVFWFVFLLAGLVIWASVGMLDVLSFAQGEVIPSTQIKQVQHLEGGVIRRILVKEGDKVQKGQPLVELENVASDADVGEITARLASLEVDNARLQAEATGANVVVFSSAKKAAHPDLVKRAEELFSSNRLRREEKLASLRESMSGQQKFVQEIQARIKNNKKRLTLVEEQVTISKQLLEKDITNRYAHLDLLKQSQQISSSIEEDGMALQRAQAASKEAQANLASVGHEFEEAAREKLAENRRQITELTVRLQKFQNSLFRTVLTAPVDGVVKTLYLVTEGGVIPPGGTAMDLVPGDDRLVVEAKLPIQDIGYVSVGQHAFITLTSADASRFGKLAGTVVQISPDALVTKEGHYYKVRVETEQAYFQKGAMNYRLFPGMIVRCAIHTGQRSVLEYLFYPFQNFMDPALTER